MNLNKQLPESDVAVSQRRTDDGSLLAADFGSAVDATVDVVGGTVIVVVDGEQYEIDVEGDAEAVMNNGVLTIEVDE